jgi:hypothetical protein
MPKTIGGVELKFRNSYRHCGQEWEDEWDSMCNDRCPVCNKEIEPYESEEINPNDNCLWGCTPENDPENPDEERSAMKKTIWIMAADVKNFGSLRITVADSERELLVDLWQLAVAETDADDAQEMSDEELKKEISDCHRVYAWAIEDREVEFDA